MSGDFQSPVGRGARSPVAFLAAALLAVGSLAASLPAAAAAAAVAIGPYDPNVEYPTGSLAIGPDDNTYRASKEVKGVDPTQAKADSWRLVRVSTEVVLDVPKRFATIAEAMSFLVGCRIDESARVVVLVAPGTFEHDVPLFLNHDDGVRIVIRGAGEKQEDCVLVFQDNDADEQDGIVVNDGHGIALENLTVASASKTGKGIGLLVNNRSTVTVTNCHFKDFTCVGGGNSKLTLTRCEFRLGRPGDAVHVRNGAEAEVFDCVAIGGPKNRSDVAYHAYNGGRLFCVGCRAEGWGGAFKAYTNSVMHLERCAGVNCTQGATAWFTSSLNLIGCTFAKNEQVGVGALWSSSVSVVDCRLTDNGAGAWTIGNACVQFLDKTSTISGSRIGVEAKAGGRGSFMAKPVFRNVATPLGVGGGPGDLPIEAAFNPVVD